MSEEKRQDDELVQQLKWYADQAQCPSEKMHWVLAFQEIEALQQRVGELENSEAASAALIRFWTARAMKSERLLHDIREDARSGQCELDVINLIDQVLHQEPGEGGGGEKLVCPECGAEEGNFCGPGEGRICIMGFPVRALQPPREEKG